MKPKKSDQEIWNREIAYAQEPEYWMSFALETKICAEFLLGRFEKAKWSPSPDDPPLRAFFAYKYVRMLYGYSLENLIKGLLLSGEKKANYLKTKGDTTKITFGLHGHDLEWLLGELEVQVTAEQKFFLDAWSISAEWYGKYPFPTDMNKVLTEYASMPSSEALLRRAQKGKREFIHHDLLHGGIGETEIIVFKQVFGKVLALYQPELVDKYDLNGN